MPEKYLQEELDHLDEYNVLVDIEDTTHVLKDSAAQITNEFAEYKGADDFECTSEDFVDWTGDYIGNKMVAFTGWSEDEAGSNFGYGDGDEWPGFHEISDIIWTGETDEYEWMSGDYDVELAEDAVPEKFTELLDMDHVANVEIVTSRGNWLSDYKYDVESAMAERVSSDLGVPEDMIYFEEGDKTDRDEPRPNILIDDNHYMALDIKEMDDMAALVPLRPHNEDYDFAGHSDSFAEKVDAIGKLGEKV